MPYLGMGLSNGWQLGQFFSPPLRTLQYLIPRCILVHLDRCASGKPHAKRGHLELCVRQICPAFTPSREQSGAFRLGFNSTREHRVFPLKIEEEQMKCFSTCCVTVLLVFLAHPAVHAQSQQIIPGTQVRLSLVSSLTTSKRSRWRSVYGRCRRTACSSAASSSYRPARRFTAASRASLARKCSRCFAAGRR